MLFTLEESQIPLSISSNRPIPLEELKGVIGILSWLKEELLVNYLEITRTVDQAGERIILQCENSDGGSWEIEMSPDGSADMQISGSWNCNGKYCPRLLLCAGSLNFTELKTIDTIRQYDVTHLEVRWS